MTENKRYKVAIYDEKAISGYCVLDLEKPSQTARLKYNNIFIGTKEGCDIVCDLLNEREETIQRLKEIREEQIQTILKQKRKIKELTAQLKTDEEDDICIKCKHHYLINYPESSKYYISKCKKEHEECSKENIRFCEDFEFELGCDVE